MLPNTKGTTSSMEVACTQIRNTLYLRSPALSVVAANINMAAGMDPETALARANVQL